MVYRWTAPESLVSEQMIDDGSYLPPTPMPLTRPPLLPTLSGGNPSPSSNGNPSILSPPRRGSGASVSALLSPAPAASSSSSSSSALTHTKYTEKVDIYSLGVLIWAMLCPTRTPVPCFPSEELASGSPCAAPGIIPDWTPEALARLIYECWQWRPERRPTAKELLERLDALDAELMAAQSQEYQPLPPPQQQQQSAAGAVSSPSASPSGTLLRNSD
jgi:serine/threonine protein kinase